MKSILLTLVLLLVALPMTAKDDLTTRSAIRMPYLDPADPPSMMLYRVPGLTGPEIPDPKSGKEPKPLEFYKIQVAAWADGRVVWSHDLKKGGSPYYEAKIDAEEFREARSEIQNVTSGTAFRVTSYTIPDAGNVNILIRFGDGSGISWQSSHPVFSDPRLHFSSMGVSSAKDFDPSAPVSAEEAEFRRFRELFDQVSERLRQLPPGKSLQFRYVRDEVRHISRGAVK